MPSKLPNIVITNLHRRFTGISATILNLVPIQRESINIHFVDWGELGLKHSKSLFELFLKGFTRPLGQAKFRVMHCRRDIDMIFGILLRDIFRQKWRLIFTSAQNRKPNPILRFLIERMDCVIASCEYNTQFLNWHSVIINHGVDCDRMHKGGFPDFDNDYSHKKDIGFVGRVRPLKGVDVFVEAMIKTLPIFTEYRAVIIGRVKAADKRFVEELKKKISEANLNDRIEFRDEISVEKLPNEYKKMAVCVVPSRQEGFGLVPLEAMANGVPVITTNIGSWSEVVTKDLGFVVSVDDLNAIVNHLHHLLSNPEKAAKMGKVAKEHIMENYSIKREADQICEVYQRLMMGKHVGTK